MLHLYTKINYGSPTRIAYEHDVHEHHQLTGKINNDPFTPEAMTRLAVVYHLTLKDNPLKANMPNKLFVEYSVLPENVAA